MIPGFPVTSAVIYWFRNDLRLTDNPAFTQAFHPARQSAANLHAVYVHDPKQSVETRWGFQRMGEHRKAFLAQRLQDLPSQLKAILHRLTS